MLSIHKLNLVLLFYILASSAVARELEPQALPTADDNYMELAFRKPPIKRLPEFGSQLSFFGRAGFHPWNGSYWPTYKGMLGHRYNDKNFPDSEVWAVNHHYYMSAPPEYYLVSGRADELSPSEKYDLLLEDSNWTLTRLMWRKGERVAQTYGNVPKWFGICHGWSAVNHMRVPEPGRPIVVTSVNGAHQITFYPSDVKALLSYLWAESSPKSMFIGKRCRHRTKPPMDSSGRILDPSCFDNNPMTWHLAILNRVGRDGDSLVMDSSMDGSVWNYAVDSYHYRYFDPRTLRPIKNWRQAAVRRKDYTADPYQVHRAPATEYIVGVVMDVYFPAATEPRAGSMGGESLLLKQKRFVYDLELDAKMNVIGGEWHSTERPDFLWTFPYTATATTPWDSGLGGDWPIGYPLPLTWADAAMRGSEKGKVLSTITNSLLSKSLAY